MKLYIEYDGVQYYDYDLHFINPPYWVEKMPVVIDDNVLCKLRTMISSLKSNNKLAKGSEICVIPDCKYNLEDVRKNYKIKRGHDKGDANVFSEETIGKLHCTTSVMLAVIPSCRAAVTNFYFRDHADFISEIHALFPTVKDNEIIRVKIQNAAFYTVTACNLPEAYLKLLTGQLTKPCVHIDDLDLNTGEELTVDSLHIVYKLCSEEHKGSYLPDGWDEKLKIQLAALNNLDWRKYPGTIDVLMNGFEWKRDSVMYQMRCNSSRYPKNVRNLLRFHADGFASKEDLDLACGFVRTVMKVEGVQFTSLGDIWKKMEDSRLNPLTFLKLFDNMVRLKDKEWKDE
jgi:hypothetical protein